MLSVAVELHGHVVAFPPGMAVTGLDRTADPEVEGQAGDAYTGGPGDRSGPVPRPVVHDEDIPFREMGPEVLDDAGEAFLLVKGRNDDEGPGHGHRRLALQRVDCP